MGVHQRTKKATNVTLDQAMLEDARALGINISQAAEAGVRAAVREAWIAENRAAIEANNKWVEENGLPLENTACSMSRFDLHRSRDGAGYVLDLQSEYLEDYSTRVVAPVVLAADFTHPVRGLNPVLDIHGETFVVLTHFLAAVPAASLGPCEMNLSDHADAFTRALDLLFQGH